MSSVKTQSRYDASRHINYISTAAFNSAFFTYTFTGPSQANNFTGSGALSAVLNSSGAAVTATDCPAGRVLRTNGKRLYPDAAGIPVASLADRTPLIGVFDYQTNLSGFINPNATVFALYNVDKPVDDIGGTAAGSTNNTRGMSVYTGGNVNAAGSITMGSGYLNEYRPLTASAITTALTLTSTDPTATTTYMVGAIITQAPGTNGQALNLPSTVDLITALGTTIGATFKFTFVNTHPTNNTVLTAQSGTNVLPTGLTALTINALTGVNFIVRLTSSSTVTVYRA
jgi:hypothetical protein